MCNFPEFPSWNSYGHYCITPREVDIENTTLNSITEEIKLLPRVSLYHITILCQHHHHTVIENIPAYFHNWTWSRKSVPKQTTCSVCAFLSNLHGNPRVRIEEKLSYVLRSFAILFLPITRLLSLLMIPPPMTTMTIPVWRSPVNQLVLGAWFGPKAYWISRLLEVSQLISVFRTNLRCFSTAVVASRRLPAACFARGRCELFGGFVDIIEGTTYRTRMVVSIAKQCSWMLF